MKLATKGAARKAVPAAAVATAKALKTLAQLADRESAPGPSARTLVLLAIADLSPIVTVTEHKGAVTSTPANLLDLNFDDPAVGISDPQMPLLLGRVDAALNDAHVSSLIHKNLLAGPPSAAIKIGDLCNLIQLWIEGAQS